jgi:hypothetical protein
MFFIHLLITAILSGWIWSQNLDLGAQYIQAISFVQDMPLVVYGWIVVVCCLLVFLTVILEQLKSYTLMYTLSRIVFEISLLGVSLLSFAALFFGWVYLNNVWLDLIPVVFLPYLGIFVSMIMFQLFDFNYPYRKRVVLSCLFSWVSFVVVIVHLM